MKQSSDIGTRRDRDDRDSRDREGSIDYRRREREASDERERQGVNIFRRQERDEREIYGTPINRSAQRREFDELGRAPVERNLYNDRRNNIGRPLGPNMRDLEYDDRNPNRRGRYHPHENPSQRDYFSHHRMYRYREHFDDWELRTIPRSRERKRSELDRPRSERDRERNDRDRNASIPRERQLNRVGTTSRECTNQYVIHGMNAFDYELESRQKFSFGFSNKDKDLERDEFQSIGLTYVNRRNRNRSTSPSPRSSVTSSSSYTRHPTRSPVPKSDTIKSEETAGLSPTIIHNRSKPPSIKSGSSPHHFDIEQSVFMRLQNRDEKTLTDDNSLSGREKIQRTPEYKDEEFNTTPNFNTDNIQGVEISSQSNTENEKGGWTGWHSLERREVDQNQGMEESETILRNISEAEVQEREINFRNREHIQSRPQNNDTVTSIEVLITENDREPMMHNSEPNNDTLQNQGNDNTSVNVDTRIPEIPGLDNVTLSRHIKTEELSNMGEERPKFDNLFEELEYVEGQIDIWEGLRDKKLEQIEKKRKFSAEQKAIKRLKCDTEKVSKSTKKASANISRKISSKRLSPVTHHEKTVDVSSSVHRQKSKTLFTKSKASENSTITINNKDIYKNTLLDRWFNNQTHEHNSDSLDESKDKLFSKFQRKFQQGIKMERELREDYESRLQSKALDDEGSDSSIKGEELTKGAKSKMLERRNTKSKGKQRADPIQDNSTTSGFAVRYPVRTTRSRRCSDYVTTDQEFAEILQKLGAEDKQGQEQQRGESSRARIPPLQIDVSGQKASNFVDNSGRVLDPPRFYGHDTPLGSNWSFDEKTQFEELFKIAPKDFNKIADKMAHKTAGDCAIFYKHLKTARTKSGEIDEKKREIYNRLHDMKVKPKKRGQKRTVRGRSRTNFSSNQVPSPTRTTDTIEQPGVIETVEKPDVSLQVSQLQSPNMEYSPAEVTKETSINNILDQEVGEAALALTLMARQIPVESTGTSSEQALSKNKTFTIGSTESRVTQQRKDTTLSIVSLLNPSDEFDPSALVGWFDDSLEDEESFGNK